MERRNFIKMNGAGNDFVVIDARETQLSLSREQVRALASRNNTATKGCDQVIVMESSADADLFMRIYNADGGEVDACGNATRCVGWLVGQEKGGDGVTIRTNAGTLLAECVRDGRVRVDMGVPKIDWRDIPLAHECDTKALPIDGAPAAVSMGNPHMVFVVDDVKTAPVSTLGREMEHHPLYPKCANVGFAQILSLNTISLRVWERGVGETPACGTGACAAVVALHRQGLIGCDVQVHLPGGLLHIEWDKNSNHVFMTGSVAKEFEGMVDV